MNHYQIVEIADRLINLDQREAAKAEFSQIIGSQIPEIEKVQILSVAEMHLLNVCSLISNSRELLLFLCIQKQEIKTPHLAKFIKEYMSLENGQFRVSNYVERKLVNSDFNSQDQLAQNITLSGKKAKRELVKVA